MSRRQWSKQWIGYPSLVALPILALSGLLDDTNQKSTARSPVLEMHVEAPRSLRHGVSEDLRLRVINVSGRTLEDVVVDLDPEYLGSFTNVRITPAPQAPQTLLATQSPSRVALEEMSPGETRTVIVALEGKRYGRSQGEILASVDGSVALRIPLKSFTFP